MNGLYLDAGRIENRGVLEFLTRRNQRRCPLVERPDAFDQPYLSLGSHPDVVERLWKGLAPQATWRVVVLGTPAVAEPDAGTVLAVALGTSYWLRLAPVDLEAALRSGVTQEHVYGGDRRFDAVALFGPTWVHGSWDDREPEWLIAAGDADRVTKSA
jgi:hypothetical protein